VKDEIIEMKMEIDKGTKPKLPLKK